MQLVGISDKFKLKVGMSLRCEKIGLILWLMV